MDELTQLIEDADLLTRDYHTAMATSRDPVSMTIREMYVSQLLPLELRIGRMRGAIQEHRQIDLLVLPVGFSLEPLLQTILVYKPKEVFLLLSNEYAWPGELMKGKKFGKRIVQPLIATLKDMEDGHKTMVRKISAVLEDDHDKPKDVFRFLLRELKEDVRKRNIVLDITGSKKSIISGCTLFADYTGSRVTYVDFDKYDMRSRRPLGYMCRIDLLDRRNEHFSIREWTRIRNLFEQFAFRNAADELEQMIGQMEAYFDSAEVSAMKKLHHTLLLKNAWLNGNYHKAYQLRKGSDIPLKAKTPSAINTLGPIWPQSGEKDSLALVNQKLKAGLHKLKVGKDGAPPFYHNSAQVLSYVGDELFKIQQLIDRAVDYRSTFLRAVGLTEFLVKQRLVVLERRGFLHASDGQDAAFFDWIVGEASFKDALWILLTMWRGSSSKARRHNPHLDIEIYKESNTPVQANFDSVISLLDLRLRRNDVAHTVLQIPRSLAEAAVAVAHDNFRDYFKNYVLSADKQKLSLSKIEDCMPNADEFDWDHLCEACGVSYLPTL